MAAAGNEGKGDNIWVPAQLNNELAVAATKGNGARASFSSTGPGLDISAPGQDNLSTVRDGYETKSGTSMASLHVVGAAVLVVDAFSNWSNSDVVSSLLNTVDNLGDSNKYGAGLVDAQEAAMGQATSP